MPKKKERNIPKPGAVFERNFGRKRHTLTIVNFGQGIGYKVGKTIYRSPSGAAKAITKCEVNGWNFWRIDT
jgi:hypothetical protein